jgi:hypothetical protein
MEMTATKQRQHRPKTRAPHGTPTYTKQIGAWVTKAMFEKFHRRGGSAWLRRIMADA